MFCTAVSLRSTLTVIWSVVLSTVCFADDRHGPVQRAVEKAVEVLQRGARAYPSHQSCFACHHQTLPALALKSAQSAGISIDQQLIPEQLQFTRKSFEERKARLGKGEHVGGRAATVSYGLWMFHLAEAPADDLGEAMTTYLLSVQQDDGSWKPPSIRPPLEVSSVSCTVLSARGIQQFASAQQRARVEDAIDRAKIWLGNAPLEDQEDLNFALWGNKLFGEDAVRRNELLERILAARRADGGWSQNQNLQSDAYSTGQTAFILAEAGLATDEAAIREAVAFLLETQDADGSWHVRSRSKPVQPWFDNGDPHDKDQFISIAGTSWAAAALAKTRQGR